MARRFLMLTLHTLQYDLWIAQQSSLSGRQNDLLKELVRGVPQQFLTALLQRENTNTGTHG